MLVVPFLAVVANLLAFASAHNLSARTHSHRLSARRVSTATALEFLEAHNEHRAAHDADPLAWSTDLAVKADEWAQTCNFASSEGVLSSTSYGELMTAATGDYSIKAAVGTFMSDKKSYNAILNPYNHFSQVVWKSTTQVGCAVAHCNGIFPAAKGKATFYVCLYDPPGNLAGKSLFNVGLGLDLGLKL